MRIITLTCPNCGTIVSANELETNRVMKCPGITCDTVLEFEGLAQEDQDFFVKNREQYQM
nr:hypothetical protein [Haladaptatus sp. YSMS36]